MKLQRHNAIKDLLAKAAAANGTGAITNQDELRRKLAARGIHVTQATLSRDIRELKLLKGPAGYELPVVDEEEEQLPEIGDVLQNYGLEVRQAQNLLIVHTTMGGARGRRHHRRRERRPHHLPGQSPRRNPPHAHRDLHCLTPPPTRFASPS